MKVLGSYDESAPRFGMLDVRSFLRHSRANRAKFCATTYFARHWGAVSIIKVQKVYIIICGFVCSVVTSPGYSFVFISQISDHAPTHGKEAGNFPDVRVSPPDRNRYGDRDRITGPYRRFVRLRWTALAVCSFLQFSGLGFVPVWSSLLHIT